MTPIAETDITPDMLIRAYENGYFPMAMAADDSELYWFSPDERGVMPIADFHIPRGLKRAMKKHDYTVTVDRCFDAVIRGCASVSKGRSETWINETIMALYGALHARGQAHSVEVWARLQHSAPTLIGGLYGVSIGGAFFGESMFSRAPDASKIALVTLVEILSEAGYELLDTQYVNEHLKQFGVEAWLKARYMTKLENALRASPNPSSLFSTVSVRKGLASSSSVNFTSAS